MFVVAGQSVSPRRQTFENKTFLETDFFSKTYFETDFFSKSYLGLYFFLEQSTPSKKPILDSMDYSPLSLLSPKRI